MKIQKCQDLFNAGAPDLHVDSGFASMCNQTTTKGADQSMEAAAGCILACQGRATVAAQRDENQLYRNPSGWVRPSADKRTFHVIVRVVVVFSS